MRLTGKVESKDYFWSIIVILIILVISSWIVYITTATTKYSLLIAEAASSSSFSSTGVSVGFANQYNTNSSRTGLAVDTYPVGVAVNPVTKKIYATDEFSNTVSVISGTSSSVEGTIPVGSFPYGVAVNPFDSRVYVTNRGSNTISVIDGSTNTKLHNITVQNSPVGVAVNPSSNWIYVTNIDSDTVSVIDGIIDKVTSNIVVGKIPYGIATNPITGKVYVTNIGSDSVSVIDGLKNKVTANITVGKNPVGIAVNPTTNAIYVTSYASNSVSVIDGLKNKVTANITVGKNPVGIAVNPITNKIYVTNIQSNTVSVINGITNKVMSTITVNPSFSGSYPIRDPALTMPIAAKFPLIASLVGIDDFTNMIYVTNTGSNTVSIINGKTDNVEVKVGFSVNPPNSGDIQCNGQQILPDSYLLYRNGTNLTCSANAGQGYKFNSWSNIAYGSSNPLNLKVSQYGGILTANFSGTLSLEQYLVIIIGSISITSIIVGWLFRSRQRRHLNKYMTLIDAAYEAFSENNNNKECLLRLQQIRNEITHSFKRGKINDSYFNILQSKISEYTMKLNS